MEPFIVRIEQERLDDLANRLQRTRWPDVLSSDSWQLGASLDFVQSVCRYWQSKFDWRAAEARLNAFPQFQSASGLHLIHAKSDVPNATALLLTNGWPSSIFEYLDIIPKLTAAGFHVVAPALPGYGFSKRPTAPGMNTSRIAELFAALMQELGYDRFLAHGSDMGAGVLEQIRRKYPSRLIGLHFSNVYWGYPRPADPTPEEQAYLAAVQQWQFMEGAYAMVQGTKPQTLSYGLNDSPAGLAAWILEKFHAWTDVEPGTDELCANLTLYWVTETIGSSCRLYAEAFADYEAQKPAEKGSVPVGVFVCPKDILPAPRAWGERWLNLVHWTESPRGGHFPAWEVPDLLAADLEEFRAVCERSQE